MDSDVEQVEHDRFMAAEDPRVRMVELTISGLLRIGVLSSFAIVVLGAVLSFVQHGQWLWGKQQLPALISSGAKFPHSARDVFGGAVHFDGPSLVMVGLLLLIATPVMRVAISVLAFVYQKDRRFVIITCIVLALLLTSFVLGHGE